MFLTVSEITLRIGIHKMYYLIPIRMHALIALISIVLIGYYVFKVFKINEIKSHRILYLFVILTYVCHFILFFDTFIHA